jgi:hypothetical protein
MLTDERRAEIKAAFAESMSRLCREIATLQLAASDRAELAATTIAGLEREVASLQASLKVHVDGERRLRAEVFRLRAERESNECMSTGLLAPPADDSSDSLGLRRAERDRDAMTDGSILWNPNGKFMALIGWSSLNDKGEFDPIPCWCECDTREQAVAAVRKAAGLDLVLGGPIPSADGGPDA